METTLDGDDAVVRRASARVAAARGACRERPAEHRPLHCSRMPCLHACAAESFHHAGALTAIDADRRVHANAIHNTQ